MGIPESAKIIEMGVQETLLRHQDDALSIGKPDNWWEIGMDVNWEPTLLRLRPLENGTRIDAFRHGQYFLDATIQTDESADEVRSAEELATTIEDIRDRVLSTTIVTVTRLDSPDALVEQEVVSALSARLAPHGGTVKPPPVRGPLPIEFEDVGPGPAREFVAGALPDDWRTRYKLDAS